MYKSVIHSHLFVCVLPTYSKSGCENFKSLLTSGNKIKPLKVTFAE